MKHTSIITTIALAGLSLTQAFAAPTIFSRGHTDVGIAFEGGAFDLHIHSEGYDLEAEPGAGVLRLLPQTEAVVPLDPQFAFLGSAGTPVWILPQDEPTATALDVLLLGFGAEEADPADFVGNITGKLTNVVFTPEAGGSPTATVSIFTTGLGGVPTVIMSTHDGLDVSDVASVTPGTHFDANWAFSQPGRYVLTFEVTGTRSTVGNPVVTASAAYTFVVKSYDSATGAQIQGGEPIVVGAGAGLITAVSPVVASADGSGLFLSTLKKFGANTALIAPANDRALLRVKDYVPTIVAREDDSVIGIAGSKIKAFIDAIENADGTIVANATLLVGAGGVLATTDTVLAVGGATGGLSAAIREGDGAPGLAGYNFVAFSSYLPGPGNHVTGIATVRNAALNKTKYVVFRATPGASPTILATTGEALATDAGNLIVSRISRPTRLNQPFASADGSVQILITFTDGSSQVVRFAQPVAVED